MRDPDLVVRAQRAAAELERAWDRFRTAHGLGAEPLAPVSSYVGYSLEEPWGEPRVVFGVAAEEAEQLAALLNSHDRGGRSAAAQAGPGGSAAAQAGPGQPAAVQAGPGRSAAANGRLASLTAAAEIARAAVGARLQVPAQGPTARRENPANFADAPERPVTAQAPGAPQPASPRVTAVAPARAESLPGDGRDPDPFPDEQHAVGGQPAERPRGHRHAGGHATQRPARPKRGSAAAEHDPLPPAKRAAARRGDGQGHDGDADSGGSGLAAMADDLAGWASGELPGQARPTASWTPTYTDPDNADPAGGDARRDKVI